MSKEIDLLIEVQNLIWRVRGELIKNPLPVEVMDVKSVVEKLFWDIDSVASDLHRARKRQKEELEWTGYGPGGIPTNKPLCTR